MPDIKFGPDHPEKFDINQPVGGEIIPDTTKKNKDLSPEQLTYLEAIPTGQLLMERQIFERHPWTNLDQPARIKMLDDLTTKGYLNLTTVSITASKYYNKVS